VTELFVSGRLRLFLIRTLPLSPLPLILGAKLLSVVDAGVTEFVCAYIDEGLRISFSPCSVSSAYFPVLFE
jgi:hypothetical protein